ncbi:sulfate ABC transporter substrate-binding protein [Mesorhizobium sp. M2D.F.Ca.ET.185.01.1.1]|uniref:sulfate ABC transporter substrate-binding protein n=1 Tax=unclassified Mesorhizobium TaxID=325217 RepID=UPI000FCB3F62|nr:MULTISPECIES: sulfate ABC transporter substrate-binding protein [unclassified Mesorhizobium]TGP74234.1 sulfate ABC transporter substrate-binding protein [bacterium M00.F.Ca.ET.227.01.1.1]TGU04546.1 sulfate ABC transporter substrate-binding protein [bacterium M00.F.Ca.ET.163.01.1.1]TGU33887.1 sulfate ABC transporter substrate-binding protein [bacterium M00.F.Ca.ET.156.01.1.1]TGU43360.1 sulfate ABC transporter substrate-binding protein [bacterium M00.F.Ca.ET.146.01.1.1]TGW09030.1 sulfate ABC 
MTRSLKTWLLAPLLAGAVQFGTLSFAFADTTILNVSYDPTRELYKAYDEAFAAHWKAETGETVTIQQSHGGSGAQARAVIDGLNADVVTLALEGDINAIVSKSKKINPDWRKKFENNSAPYTSTIIFLVRKGNPKGIHDWSDLVKDGVQVITPNPKTSGGARWNYLAAWAYANAHDGNDEAKTKEFISKLYANAPVLDSGARGSTVTFAQKGLGDVLIGWENDAYLALDEFGADNLDIVYPPTSILAEPPVAVVDANVDAKGTRKVAKAYLSYLYSKEGQTIIAKNHYRPAKPELVPAEDLAKLPAIKLVTIDDPQFGGWKKAQPYHFGDGGIFDQIYKPAK